MLLVLSIQSNAWCQVNSSEVNPDQKSERNQGVGVFNIVDYGAKGDGKTLNTGAIQAAIDACNANKGGMVLVPAGDFLSGALLLKSNVALHLASSALILGSTNEEDYYLGGERSPAFINAEDADNITIEGKGTINGQGWAFPHGSEALPADPHYKQDALDTSKPRWRPHMLEFINCRYLTLRDITLTQSGNHCTHITNCSFLKINGVRIHNRSNHNNDGFDFTNCENVTVTNCNLSCGDDAMAFFEGNRNVIINDCIISSRWAGIRLGPASTGVFENIAVSNCVFFDTYGSAIKIQMSGGGKMENISFSDLIMNNVTGPISIVLTSFKGYQKQSEEYFPVGVLRNIQFSRIRAAVADKPNPLQSETPIFEGENKSCMTITSVNGHYIENVRFSDIEITFPGGGTSEDGQRRDIPELRGIYPEYFMFGVLPSYGMYVRNVQGLSLDNVRFDYQGTELRPAIVCQGVDGLDITGFRAEGSMDAEALIRIEQSKNVFIQNSRPLNDIANFVRVEGDMCSEIHLNGNNLGRADKIVVTGNDVHTGAVIVK
ncbi:glycoside hydrolase family 28 protein [Bacteroidota bacterium]